MKLIFWCKKHYKLLCIDIVCALIALVVTCMMNHMTGVQYSQQEADRWQSDGTIKYHQVSVFLQNDCAAGLETISQVRSTIQAKLLEASYTQDSVRGRLWVDAYMAKAQDSISKASDMGVSGVDRVNILGVGGDFFQFHAQDMLAGNMFSDDDISQDKVLIDRETAWTLYGGVDIAGKTVQIGGRQFIIAGVYEASEEKAEVQARGKDSYVFMDYDLFHELYPDKNIVCYEAVVPNPVKGFGLLAIKEAFGESDEDLYADGTLLSFSDKEYVDNTNRFQTMTLLGRLRSLPQLLMHTTQVSFPYWENAVRVLELKLEALLVLKIVVLLPVAVTIAILLVMAVQMLRRFIKENFAKWKDAAGEKWDDMARKRMRRQEEGKENRENPIREKKAQKAEDGIKKDTKEEKDKKDKKEKKNKKEVKEDQTVEDEPKPSEGKQAENKPVKPTKPAQDGSDVTVQSQDAGKAEQTKETEREKKPKQTKKPEHTEEQKQAKKPEHTKEQEQAKETEYVEESKLTEPPEQVKKQDGKKKSGRRRKKKVQYKVLTKDGTIIDPETESDMTSDEGTSDKEISNKEVSGKETSGKETPDKGVSDKETSDKRISGKKISNEKSADKKVSGEKAGDEEQ